jgi:hypothetical protein
MMKIFFIFLLWFHLGKYMPKYLAHSKLKNFHHKFNFSSLTRSCVYVITKIFFIFDVVIAKYFSYTYSKNVILFSCRKILRFTE